MASKRVRHKIKQSCDTPSPITRKRKCAIKTPKNGSEEIIWPDEEEESFFSNSRLDDLLRENRLTPRLFESQRPLNSPHDKFADESLFSISKLENLFEKNTECEGDRLFESLRTSPANKSGDLCSTHFKDFLNGNGTTLVCKDNGPASCNIKEDLFWQNTSLGQFSNEKSLFHSQGSEKNSRSSNRSGGSANDASSTSAIKTKETDTDTKTDKVEEPFHKSLMEGNETLFSDINLNDLTKKEQEDLFADAHVEDGIDAQNTQKFFDDVAFKVPQLCKRKTIPKTARKAKVDIRQYGSQYILNEEIQNYTLSNLNWETQAFPELRIDPKISCFPSKGDFYDLPAKVKHLIFEHKGIKSLYEWQDECLRLSAVAKRKNLIYALPTSGGKTLVAEILMLREVICREKNVLFVLPYVSIVQEKVGAMSPFAIALDFIVDEYTAGKGKCPPTKRRKRRSIFIASIEKGAVLMDSLIDAQRADEIGLVVVDELHLIGERGRGATLEALLTKIKFLDANIQIVGMSATIGNLTEIATFLNADVYTRGFRPVELKEYIKCGNDILEINVEGKTLEEVFVYKRSVNFKYSDVVARSDPDHLAGLVTECAPENCCLIFCPSRKNCENVALLLSRILPKSKFLEHRKKEKTDLMDALDKVCGVLSPVLAKTIPYGIAYHHSGLTTDERKFIETAYRFEVLSVICCTSTLAAGVNLPAKRVIIRAPYVGVDFMTLCKYKQMVGRAGRAGMGEAGESILITSSRDNVRVGEMLFSPMDKAMSSLDHDDCIGLQALILSAVGLEIASCRNDLYRLVNSTLLAVQANCQNISIEELILKILREMFKNKVLEVSALSNTGRNCSSILTTQEVKSGTSHASQLADRKIFVSKSTRFQLTTIGRAAFKAGIDYKRTYVIYNELKSAQQHLILTNYAHLLYLVVCFNSNSKGDELFSADAGILFRLYTSVDETTQKLFKLLNFTEAHAAKIAKTLSVQGSMELKLNRLYKVLILVDLLNVEPLPTVATKYNIERGLLQNLINQSTSAASAIVRLCEQIEEFWCFKPLFERINGKMDRCGTLELEPLLDLPSVKINRAKQLYAAGYKTIEDIAKVKPIELVKTIEHMPLKIAKEIVSAAKIILMKKLDSLEEETEALKLCLLKSEVD